MSDHPEENGNLIYFIASTVEEMRDRMATKDDLARFATKDDLARLETKLSDRMEAGFAAVRGDIERVHLRLDGIERALSSRLDHV